MKNKKIVVIIILCFIFICSASNKTLGIVNNNQDINSIYNNKENGKYEKTMIFDKYLVITIFTSISFISIGYILWYKYGKDRENIETIQFYPPDGYNSAEINFIYNDGEVNSKGVLSLLIYLANKGYIQIEETNEGETIGEFHTFNIIKLKEYNGKNIYEKIF